jgi:hypothetical protein
MSRLSFSLLGGLQATLDGKPAELRKVIGDREAAKPVLLVKFTLSINSRFVFLECRHL